MQKCNSYNNTQKVKLIAKGAIVATFIFGMFCVTILIWTILYVIFKLFIRGHYAGKGR